jgi:Bacterial Ig-like domain (group 3)
MKRNVSAIWNAGIVYASLFAVVLMLSPSLAGQIGSTYYVSTSGSDSNTGTMSSPWLTIQHAANSVLAGATVYVLGGVYNESVNFPASGTASAPITFQSYPGETAVIDGTGVSCCTSNPPSSGNETQGLINIVNQSYIIVSGFEIRNYTTSKAAYTPAGVWITGSGTGVQLLNNLVHNITTTSEKNGNAFGISVYGTSQTPITELVISGNEVYDLKTGQSESVNVDGNVTYFKITNNLVHDNDNIGIDAIGYEGVGPVGYDEAMYGEISRNTVYNISGIKNAGEGDSYDADGLYCDGCAYVTFENNWVYNADYGIEVTSENQICLSNGTEWSGANDTGTAGTGTHPCYGRYVTVRNNIFSNSENVGVSIGGYAAATSKGGESNGGGSTYDTIFVNNTLYNNVKVTANNDASSPGGEFQIQNQIGSAQDNYFENNLVYAGTYNTWIYSFVKSSTSYPAPPATLNWNLYYSAAGYVEGTSIYWDDVSSYASFAAFQSKTSEDADSLSGENPDFESLTSTPRNFDITAASPAVNAGGTSLSCSTGWCDPNGSSPDSIYGATDFLGNPRMSSGAINIGAYETTGIASNTLTVNLTSGTSSLQPGQSTTLTATVSASPGGAGVPSGTVNFMLGSTLLGTETLSPTSATESAASMPLSASQLAAGANTLTAVYSGNTIGTNCCTAKYPPGGATQVAIYPSTTSAPITVTLE